MSDSVLDRIRQNRQRPAVPPRSDMLITQAQSPAPAVEPDSRPAVEPAVEPITDPNKPIGEPAEPTGSSDALEELKAELAAIPETHRHSAIVLEKELDQQLTRYCKDQRITVEVFLEAAWVQAAADPDALATILTEAKRRYADRKRAGKLRRLITMLEGKS